MKIIAWKSQKFNLFNYEFLALPKLPKIAYNDNRQTKADTNKEQDIWTSCTQQVRRDQD
jgi:hypothetical protein